MPVFRKQGMIGIIHRFGNSRIIHHTPVNYNCLPGAIAFKQRRFSNHPLQNHLIGLFACRQHFPSRLQSIQGGDGVYQPAISWCLNHGTAIVDKPESHIGIGQCHFPYHGINPAAFCAF